MTVHPPPYIHTHTLTHVMPCGVRLFYHSSFKLCVSPVGSIVQKVCAELYIIIDTEGKVSFHRAQAEYIEPA